MTRPTSGYLTRSEEVYNGIVFRISEGFWNDGDKLPSEAQLCEMFGVSRSSVRAAIQRLLAQGLVETRVGIGSFVRIPYKEKEHPQKELSSSQFLEFFEFRQAIEFKAIELFAYRATENDFRALEYALIHMENSDDLAEFSRWDYEFHAAIIAGAHNSYIQEAFDNQREMFKFFLAEVSKLDNKRSLKEQAASHRLSYQDMLEKKPGSAISRLFRENAFYHLTVFRDDL
ncbi:MAG: FadR family transcriptional regulator [Oscillospiraceae bacterium]|nr:FadR family transcriptional regulator [Oscillospiraceae bacterium]